MTLNLFKACIMSNHSRATKKNQITMIECVHGGQWNKKTSKKAPRNWIFSDFDHWRPYISIYIYIYIYINIYIIYIYYILLLKTTLYNIWQNILVKEQLSFWRSDLPRRYWKDFEIDILLLGAKIFRDFFSTFCLG